MDKVDVVESMIGAYLGTFCMLGYLGLWDMLFGMRMNEESLLVGFGMCVSSALCGVVTGIYLAYVLRRVL